MVTETEIFHCCFTSQMAIMAGTEQSCSQRAKRFFWFPMQVQEPEDLNHSLLLFHTINMGLDQK